MREGVCELQEGLYAIDSSPFEMTSRNLSSVFLIFFRTQAEIRIRGY